MAVKMQFICNGIQHCLNLSGIVLQGNSEFIHNLLCELQEVTDTCTCWCVCWSWYEIEVLCANSKWEQASWWSKTTLQWCGWLDPTNYFLHWRSWYILIPTPHLSLWKCSLEINQIIEQHIQSSIFWTPKCVQQIPKCCPCSWQILDMLHHRSIAPSFAFCPSPIQTNRSAIYFKRNTKQMQLEMKLQMQGIPHQCLFFWLPCILRL